MFNNNRFASQIIGAITAGTMITWSLILYLQRISGDSVLQYGIYALMAIGITTALVVFKKNPALAAGSFL